MERCRVSLSDMQTDDLTEPSFPPLLKGEEAAPGQDPFDKAIAAASIGTDAGLVVWARRGDALDAAMVLAPEQKLAEAMGVGFALSVGLGDAIGALAPPEVAVHYTWPGGIKINGADCGRFRAASSHADPSEVPDWLVFGITLPYLPGEGAEGGAAPDQTSLIEEGCGDVTPLRLLESWSRHSLAWINTFIDQGMAPLHRVWTRRAWQMGDPLPDGAGMFMGLDEQGGMLVKSAHTTRLRPLPEWLK